MSIKRRLTSRLAAAVITVALCFGMSVGAATAFSAAPSPSFTTVHYDM
jgi:hypothetical protein